MISHLSRGKKFLYKIIIISHISRDKKFISVYISWISIKTYLTIVMESLFNISNT